MIAQEVMSFIIADQKANYWLWFEINEALKMHGISMGSLALHLLE